MRRKDLGVGAGWLQDYSRGYRRLLTLPPLSPGAHSPYRGSRVEAG